MRKSFRVKKEKEFQKVFHNGVSKANRQFVIYVLDKKGQPHFRVGLSVGKKNRQRRSAECRQKKNPPGTHGIEGRVGSGY